MLGMYGIYRGNIYRLDVQWSLGDEMGCIFVGPFHKARGEMGGIFVDP